MPFWKETINVKDVFHNEEMSFEQRRDAVVARVKASLWYKAQDPSWSDLADFVEDLATVRDTDEFDEFWNAIYDEADRDRIWIATF